MNIFEGTVTRSTQIPHISPIGSLRWQRPSPPEGGGEDGTSGSGQRDTCTKTRRAGAGAAPGGGEPPAGTTRPRGRVRNGSVAVVERRSRRGPRGAGGARTRQPKILGVGPQGRAGLLGPGLPAAAADLVRPRRGGPRLPGGAARPLRAPDRHLPRTVAAGLRRPPDRLPALRLPRAVHGGAAGRAGRADPVAAGRRGARPGGRPQAAARTGRRPRRDRGPRHRRRPHRTGHLRAAVAGLGSRTAGTAQARRGRGRADGRPAGPHGGGHRTDSPRGHGAPVRRDLARRRHPADRRQRRTGHDGDPRTGAADHAARRQRERHRVGPVPGGG